MNVDWLAHLPAPARRALYFSLQRCIGSRVHRAWRQFLAWEQLGPIALDAVVEHRLAQLLDSARRQSDYYRSLHIDGPRAAESSLDWLRRFPILTRTRVREDFVRLVIDPLRDQISGPSTAAPRRYDWLVVRTGGSTGEPTAVVHDARGRDWGRATRLYALRLARFPLGTPYFRLWGSEQDLLNQQATLQQRVLRALHAEIPLNAFRARESDLQRHYERMQRRPRIRHLMTYVDAAAGFALYLRDQQLRPPTFETVMACAGTVTPDLRQLLQDTFQADVFDKYGSRECCDMACECHHHSGLHVFSPNVVLEIVDDQNRPCPPGVTGRILVTLLNNLSFPMIRYDIGDLGAWAKPDPCPCGSPFPRIRELSGRQDDLLTTEDGTLVTSVFVRHFVGVSLNRDLIRQWQLEQQARSEFVFRYVPIRHEGLPENLEALRQGFIKAFGPAARVRFEETTEIPPAPTGKTRWIINRLRH